MKDLVKIGIKFKGGKDTGKVAFNFGIKKEISEILTNEQIREIEEYSEGISKILLDTFNTEEGEEIIETLFLEDKIKEIVKETRKELDERSSFEELAKIIKKLI